MEAWHDTALVADSPMLHSIKPAGILAPTSALELGHRKIRQFVHTQLIWNFFNSLGICDFAAVPYSGLTLPLIVEAVEAITGWNTSLYELMELGERTITMARMFNVREGLSSIDDCLPERLFEPLEEGTELEKRISREEFKFALRLYYETMGWDTETGVPSDGRLGFLGLDWLIKPNKYNHG